tara:strand:+ start:16453 stop:17433 length:981 start_codon:yes stop_codon:yes gene_type:complete
MLYDYKILNIYDVNSKIISIGNMSTGGTGKTPMVEYILRLLNNYNVAILSRGYMRKTRGFIIADDKHKYAHQIGDENSQLFNKFQNTLIACDTNRYQGAKKLIAIKKDLEIIILDDGYQHRSLKRDLDIVLTEYDNLFIHDSLLPIGSLREQKQEIKRANIIIITKCPQNIPDQKKEQIYSSLNLRKEQKIFFSYISSYNFLLMPSRKKYKINLEKKHIIITGIQNPKTLTNFLENKSINYYHLKFNDHYNFKSNDISKIIHLKSELDSSDELLMTEKDYYRLSNNQINQLSNHFKLVCIEINTDFIGNDKSDFNNQLLKFAQSKT